MRDHAACADDGSVADADARQNGDVSAEPYVVAHGDGLCVFHARGPFSGVQRMHGGVDAALRPDEAVAAEAHGRAVENHEIVVGKEVLADFDVEAVVAAKAGFYEEILARAAENASEAFPPLFKV